jgi:hypothetical protein
MTLCTLALPKVVVGLQGSSLPTLYTLCFLPAKEVRAIVSSETLDALRDPCAEACVLTEVVMLRISGRRIAIDAAMMPVPGSAVAQIVAFIVIARFQVSFAACGWDGDVHLNPVGARINPRR